MKNLKKIIFALILMLTFVTNVNAEEANEKQVDIYFFYGDGCIYCAKAEVALEQLQNDYPNLKVHYYETWYNRDNQKLLTDVGKLLNVTVGGVPFTIIGERHYTGFPETYKDVWESRVKYYFEDEYINPVGDFLQTGSFNYVPKSTENKGTNKKEVILSEEGEHFSINLPLVGEIRLRDLSLPLIAIVMGAIDGFNPCAMWVLLFLISMLIGMKNKKRMWALGIAFLVTSAAIYMLFMLAWLNFTSVIGSVIWLRLIIALIAIVGGSINLRSYFKTKNKPDGCEIVKGDKRKKIFDNIRKITHEKSFIVALIGVMLLAISVNIIELACSAGLPVVFTGILIVNDLSSTEYFLYVLLYITVFLIDDIIVFGIAMITLEVTGISTKYSKFTHLIGGIIMLILGILLALKPEWIMFNF